MSFGVYSSSNAATGVSKSCGRALRTMRDLAAAWAGLGRARKATEPTKPIRMNSRRVFSVMVANASTVKPRGQGICYRLVSLARFVALESAIHFGVQSCTNRQEVSDAEHDDGFSPNHGRYFSSRPTPLRRQ